MLALVAPVELPVTKPEVRGRCEQPVAVVSLGGLISSTFLDMAATPTILCEFGRRAAEKYLERTKADPLDASH